MVRLVPVGVRECRQAVVDRKIETDRDIKNKKRRKEGRKNNSITEYVRHRVMHRLVGCRRHLLRNLLVVVVVVVIVVVTYSPSVTIVGTTDGWYLHFTAASFDH